MWSHDALLLVPSSHRACSLERSLVIMSVVNKGTPSFDVVRLSSQLHDQTLLESMAAVLNLWVLTLLRGVG